MWYYAQVSLVTKVAKKMIKFEISKTVAMPHMESHKPGPNPKYPFHEMEVGDSFFITAEQFPNRVREAAKQHGRKYGKRFVLRTNKEDGSARIWRVA